MGALVCNYLEGTQNRQMLWNRVGRNALLDQRREHLSEELRYQDERLASDHVAVLLASKVEKRPLVND